MSTSHVFIGATPSIDEIKLMKDLLDLPKVISELTSSLEKENALSDNMGKCYKEISALLETFKTVQAKLSAPDDQGFASIAEGTESLKAGYEHLKNCLKNLLEAAQFEIRLITKAVGLNSEDLSHQSNANCSAQHKKLLLTLGEIQFFLKELIKPASETRSPSLIPWDNLVKACFSVVPKIADCKEDWSTHKDSLLRASKKMSTEDFDEGDWGEGDDDAFDTTAEQKKRVERRVTIEEPEAEGELVGAELLGVDLSDQFGADAAESGFSSFAPSRRESYVAADADSQSNGAGEKPKLLLLSRASATPRASKLSYKASKSQPATPHARAQLKIGNAMSRGSATPKSRETRFI